MRLSEAAGNEQPNTEDSKSNTTAPINNMMQSMSITDNTGRIVVCFSCKLVTVCLIFVTPFVHLHTFMVWYGVVKFHLTNKLKYMVSNVNFDYCMVTCRETAHRIRRVFAVMQPP